MGNEPNYDSKVVSFRASLRDYALVSADAKEMSVTASDVVRKIIGEKYAGRELTERERSAIDALRRRNVEKRMQKRNKNHGLLKRPNERSGNGS